MRVSCVSKKAINIYWNRNVIIEHIESLIQIFSKLTNRFHTCFIQHQRLRYSNNEVPICNPKLDGNDRAILQKVMKLTVYFMEPLLNPIFFLCAGTRNPLLLCSQLTRFPLFIERKEKKKCSINLMGETNKQTFDTAYRMNFPIFLVIKRSSAKSSQLRSDISGGGGRHTTIGWFLYCKWKQVFAQTLHSIPWSIPKKDNSIQH